MAERLDRSHATLKLVVIALAALIVVGFGVVVTEIVRRLARLDEGRPVGFDTREVPVPVGCTLVDAVAAGERLVLRFEPAKACPDLVVVDPRTGAELGRIRPVPAP